MTSQKDIQSLIAAIDDVMPKARSRLPWLGPSDVASQRRVLEQVRSYLVSLQQKVENSTEPPLAAMSGQEAALAITSAVVQEINSLGANLMQPLHAEILALRQQREALVQEIRQLEMHRHYYESLAQQQDKQQQIIEEFLQVLLGRLQESLTQQISQSLANLEAKFLSEEQATALEEVVSPGQHGQNLGTPLHPVQRLEQMRQLQGHTDQILITLDFTLQAVFEALQRNLQGYQQSLSHGIDKMHDLGQQTELMFAQSIDLLKADLVSLDRLAPHLAIKTATTSVSTTQTTPDTLLPPPLAHTTANSATSTLHAKEIGSNNFSPETSENVARHETRSPSQSTPVNGGSLPYPGTELRPGETSSQKNLYPEHNQTLELNLQNRSLVENNDKSSATGIPPNTDIQTLTSLPLADDVQPHPQQCSDSAEVAAPSELEENTWLSSDSQCEELELLYETIFGAGDIPVQEIPSKSESFIPSHPEVSPVDESIAPASAWAGSEVEVLFTPEAAAASETNENNGEPEEIEIIRALTDLFPETPPEASSTPTATAANREEKVHATPELSLLQPQQEPETSYYEEQIGDTYVPASPEEDLLAHDVTPGKLDITLWLEQNIMQQLSEDFYSFEAATQNVETKSLSVESAADSQMQQAAQLAAGANQETQDFGMLDEVLVEDLDSNNINPTTFDERSPGE